MFYKSEKHAVFIDGVNLYNTARSLNFEVDYKLLRDEFAMRGRILRLSYFTIYIENDEYSPLRPLIDWLSYNGYDVHAKVAKEYFDAAGNRKVKGGIDVDLAVSALQMADHLDHIVIFSGDGAYRPLIEAIQAKGVRVSVASTVKTSPAMISDDLRRQADNFIEIDDIKDVIGRPIEDHSKHPEL